MEYLDFELLIDSKHEAGYPVSVIRSPAGELDHDSLMCFPFTSAELEKFVKDLPSNVIQPSVPYAATIQSFGRRLFDALLAGKLGALYRKSQIEAKEQHKGLRLKLRIRPPELAALPWEFLFDTQQGDYVCFSRYTPIVRYIEVERPVRTLAVRPPLRILGMAANPRRMFQIDVEAEKRQLADALAELRRQNLVELTWCEGATRQHLQAAMRNGSWHVFYFIGHGARHPDAREGAITLADETGMPQDLLATDLAQLLVDHRWLRLVILNACQGARGDTRDAYSSTASILVRHGLPAVLAMQCPLSDAAAIRFAHGFYRSLASGLPVDASVTEARKVIRFAAGASLEWGVPVLYMRSPDGVLFSPEHCPVPHNLPPRNEFIGRKAVKADVHAALCARPRLVCIEGIGGIGKTSLALEVAYECLNAANVPRPAGQPPAALDGIVWISNGDHNLTLDSALDTIAETLDRQDIARLPLSEKENGIVRLLREDSYLLVVDNFETIADESLCRFLTRLPEPSRALVTSREKRLPEASSIPLIGLTEAESIDLMRSEGKRLGLAALEQAEAPLLLELYRVTGGAPLAIKWALGQVKQRGQALDAVLRELGMANGRMFSLIFERSWGLLSPAAAQVLCIMPFFAAPACRAAIQAASGIDDDFALNEALGQLVEMSLINIANELESERMCYSIHPLTRVFSLAQMNDCVDAPAAWQRLARYYTEFTRQHGGYGNQAGSARIEAELANILAVVQHFWNQSLHRPVAGIFNNVIGFFIIRGHWNDLISFGNRAVELALAEGDELNAAWAGMRALAWVQRHRGELDAAEANVRWALSVFQRDGPPVEYFCALRNLGRIAERRGEFERAVQLLNEALQFFREAGHERYIFLTTTNLAKVELERGNLDAAWMLCESVSEAALRFDDLERIASLWKVKGSVAWQRGDHAHAYVLWSEALTYSRQAHRLDDICDLQFRLGLIEAEKGNLDAARQRLLEALDGYRRLNILNKVHEIEDRLKRLAPPASAGNGTQTSTDGHGSV